MMMFWVQFSEYIFVVAHVKYQPPVEEGLKKGVDGVWRTLNTTTLKVMGVLS